MTEVNFLQRHYIYARPAMDALAHTALEFKFSQCEYIAITRGNIKMKKVAAEGANRDASYVGKLFRFIRQAVSQQSNEPNLHSKQVRSLGFGGSEGRALR